MPGLTLRWKLLLFAVAIAVVPILVAARAMIRIGEDELKSSANEQLLGVAERAHPRDQRHGRARLAQPADPDPQRARRRPAGCAGEDSAPDARHLGHRRHRGPPDHARRRATCRSSSPRTSSASVCATPGSIPWACSACRRTRSGTLREAGEIVLEDATRLAATDDWLATVVLPLRTSMAGAPAILSARIDLQRLRGIMRGQPVRQAPGSSRSSTGVGGSLPRRSRGTWAGTPSSPRRWASSPRPRARSGVAPYARPDGEVMLGAYAFPRAPRWAILVERPQRDAYLAVEKMTQQPCSGGVPPAWRSRSWVR